MLRSPVHQDRAGRLVPDVDGHQWPGNVALGGRFGGGRQDLIYDPLTDDPLSIFEIKPQGSDAAAQSQLQGYLATSDGEAVAGDQSLIFTHGPTITLSGGWFGATYTYSAGEFPGTVVYTTDDRGSVVDFVTKFFGSRQSGAPMPWPPSIPPVLVPVP